MILTHMVYTFHIFIIDPLPGVVEGPEVPNPMDPEDIIRSVPNTPQFRPEVEIPEQLPRSNSPIIRALDRGTPDQINTALTNFAREHVC